MSAGTRYPALICIFFVLFTLPVIAQQTNNESISLSGGTLTYQQVATSVTCTVAAKKMYTYTRYNDETFVFHPNGGSQISIPGTFLFVSGSPGHLAESNCQPNGLISGHPLTLLQQHYQVYIYPTSTINAAYVTGTFGYINPKYVVSTVLYAPPGSASTAVYTNSTTVSNTTSYTATFTSSTMDSVSTQTGLLGTGVTSVASWLNGIETNTTSTTETQQSQNSTSVTLSLTTTNGLTVPGPTSNYVGVDHDYDVIEVWLNPVLLFTVYNTTMAGETNIASFGYGSSALDTTAPIDIWAIPVGCLNGDFPQTESACAAPLGAFQRAWAANENWPTGQGPGLTQADLNNILAADPWGKCTPNDPIGSSACPTYSAAFTLPNFELSDQADVQYTQPLPGGQPVPVSYGVNTTNMQATSSTITSTYSQMYGYEFNLSAFYGLFNLHSNDTQTVTWSYALNTSLSQTNVKTGTANITPPACVGNPCNPSYPPATPTFGTATTFDVFIDNRFGTFAFVPAAYN
jgi:hypothetical protein